MQPTLVATKASGSPVQLASLSREQQLHQALELPPSEIFVQNEPEAEPDDFELVIPEKELPESDIPLTLNSKVEFFINYFQTSGRAAFSRWLSRSERYIPMMKEVLKKNGLPEDLVYLAMIESGFSPHAYSVAAAVGPWQFISSTGKRYALRIDQWIDERRDPMKSSIAAALYLKELYDLFNKDWYLAAAGYNAGENKILRAIDMYNSRDFWQLSRGSYLKRETKDYVPKLLAAAIIAKDPSRYGFADIAYLPPIEFDTVSIPTRTDLELVARLTGVTYQTLKDLNPELRRWCTPPDYPGYELKLPKGKKGQFEPEYAKIPETGRYTEKIVYVRHKMKRKETLVAVAKRYQTTVENLTELNHLSKKSRLRGKSILVPVVADAAPKPQPAEEQKQAVSVSKLFNKYYTVKKGDTIRSLSRRFNVSEKILSAWNNIRHRGKVALKPGRRIIVAKYVEKNGEMVVSGG
ncbi:lytic transglycosylase domain-containing protein [Geobacter sp. OR-1]|uniref:lytic transglycosylase domain-containing protein n=1 Tax=Geobacter sp. OR-1 TaxID=1266765 RepID=UPI0013922A15